MNRIKYLIPALSLTLNACTTLNESLELGGSLGAVAGAAAVYSGTTDKGERPPSERIWDGAAIGLGVGLLTSYLIHKKVVENRRDYSLDQFDMHFGDLPPSPFILPKIQKKGGK